MRLFLEGGSVSCGRDDAWGLYRVILCVWRIERGVDMSVMSATERKFVVIGHLESSTVQRKKN